MAKRRARRVGKDRDSSDSRAGARSAVSTPEIRFG